ncbi:MAG TPA: peptide-methionine (S)-S-oxide reductase MsrA [Candidatus Saccharimonadales bacterium]|nr:peptide-methionine (S)-S-oxide reductase MsrA [Candidatus Saccharimonadales bacterium]
MQNLETATLAGGCFWCLDAIYRRVIGVREVVSGYSGGHKENPTTAEVYEGHTGHAEVVQISFSPSVISFRELLEIFFVMHDPTTLNRQGNDVGDEYRSAVFFHDEDQRLDALDMKENFAPTIWKKPIVTQITPFSKFWPAGEDHQDFYAKRPGYGYCQVVIDPKVAKLRQKFTSKLKPE